MIHRDAFVLTCDGLLCEKWMLVWDAAMPDKAGWVKEYHSGSQLHYCPNCRSQCGTEAPVTGGLEAERMLRQMTPAERDELLKFHRPQRRTTDMPHVQTNGKAEVET